MPPLQELADWRGRMNQQVEGYRSDLTALQASPCRTSLLPSGAPKLL